MIDTVQINRALAKALAYVKCGKMEDAEKWGLELIRLLREAGVPLVEGEV